MKRTSDADRAALTDHPESIARRMGYACPASLASILTRFGAPDLARRMTLTSPHRTGGTP